MQNHEPEAPPDLHSSDLFPLMVFQSRLTNISRSIQALSNLPEYQQFQASSHLLSLIDTDIRHLLSTCERVLILADYLTRDPQGDSGLTRSAVSSRAIKRRGSVQLVWDESDRRKSIHLSLKDLAEVIGGIRRELDLEIVDLPLSKNVRKQAGG